MLTLVNCTPASQFLRVCFSFQQRGRPTNPKLGKSPSAGGKFWKMWWEGWGALIFFLHVQTCWSSSDPQTFRRTFTNVPIMKTGVGGLVFLFFKKRCFLVSDGLRAWVWIAEEDMWRKLTMKVNLSAMWRKLTIKVWGKIVRNRRGSDHFGSGTWSSLWPRGGSGLGVLEGSILAMRET